jgi:hypothetical protein
MRSGRAKTGERRKNDGLEQTPDRRRKNNSLANVDPDSIGDRIKIEEIKRTLENDDEGAGHPCSRLLFSDRIRSKPAAQGRQ